MNDSVFLINFIDLFIQKTFDLVMQKKERKTIRDNVNESSQLNESVDRLGRGDDRLYFGPSIFSGRTHSLNCSSVKYPNLRAACLRVVPSLWAVLAIFAALS